MADDADIAADRAAQAAADALARHLRRPRPVGRPTCRVCGDVIPAERRAALPWARTCIDCARGEEREAACLRP